MPNQVKAWVKGMKSPNPSGRRNEKLLTDALYISIREDPQRARRLAYRLLNIAEEGEPADALRAMQMIYDRMEGRPAQTIEVDHTVTMTREEREARVLELSAKVIGKAAMLVKAEEEGE
jgi:hypothetical protein